MVLGIVYCLIKVIKYTTLLKKKSLVVGNDIIWLFAQNKLDMIYSSLHIGFFFWGSFRVQGVEVDAGLLWPLRDVRFKDCCQLSFADAFINMQA